MISGQKSGVSRPKPAMTTWSVVSALVFSTPIAFAQQPKPGNATATPGATSKVAEGALPGATPGATPLAQPQASVSPGSALATPAPSSTPVVRASPLPSPTPVPTPMPTPTPTPTPVPSAPASGFLKMPMPVTLSFGKALPTTLNPALRTAIVEAERNDQFALFPPSARALQSSMAIYQRRFDSNSPFGAFLKNRENPLDAEIIRNLPHVFDALVYCPLSNELIVQAPPQDARGKYLAHGRPRKIYLYSLKTGALELIWKRTAEQDGTIAPLMSATPDCRHVLVNLHLEKGKDRTPYGELIYLRRPEVPESSSNLQSPAQSPVKATQGRPKKLTAAEQEWTFSKIADTPKSGFYKNFSEALFVVPRDPTYFGASSLPPMIVAVREKTDETRSPEVFVFKASGPSSKKAHPAGAFVWRRAKAALDKSIIALKHPVTYNASSQILFLYQTNELLQGGGPKSGIGLFDVSTEEVEFQPIFVSDDALIKSFDVHPQGNRIAMSYVQSKSEESVRSLENKRLAGVAEIILSGDKSALFSVESFAPFHGLSAHHNPRPQYAADGKSLVFGVPEISEALEAKWFAGDAEVSRELQFPIKLVHWPLD